ncbi:hypothetical protein FQZ97_782540 [compost metagenome]
MISSTLSIELAGIDCKIWATFPPAIREGFPSINTFTPAEPRKLTFPSISVCTEGTFCKRSDADPPSLTRL